MHCNIHKKPDNSIEGKPVRDDNEGTDIVENTSADTLNPDATISIARTARTADADATNNSNTSKPGAADNNNHNSGHNHNHTFDPGDVDISKCNFVHDPGGKYFDIKDSVAHDDGDSTSTSSDNASCTADTHRRCHRSRVRACQPPGLRRPIPFNRQPSSQPLC